MDIFDLNPDALDTTAVVVENYCMKQSQIMSDYLSRTSALRSEWDDDQTMGTLMEEIRHLKDSVENLMDEIRTTYPSFFREKAEQIRRRPKF